MKPSGLAALALPIRALIGGRPATVAYAGNSIGVVSSVVQVDLIVPSGLSRGSHLVRVYIGPGETQAAVSISIQ